MDPEKFPRRSGVLLHPTSLPGRFGIGDLGPDAYRFVDFLASARQTYWQVLPLGPTGYADSPYQGLSAFAGNPMLISPDKLIEAGFLAPEDLVAVPDFPVHCVDFGAVIAYKTALLERAFSRFQSHAATEQREAFDRFCAAQASWLDDFALFMALKDAHSLRPWQEWEPDIARREAQALERWREKLSGPIESQKWRQWQFFDEWQAIKRYANDRGIRLIGDIPIFVARDSADVWTNIRLFHFTPDLEPEYVAGVPPDYFSRTGQLWGNPLYRWDVMAEDGYRWWIERFRMAFHQADLVRIDHFRGFYNYWEIPGGDETAERGRWVFGPGEDLFRAVTAALGDVAIIAEDLGDFDPQSRQGLDKLMETFHYPGMKVLQFAFLQTDSFGGPINPFLPYNFTRDFVVYTGTHDNDTTVGWFRGSSTPEERQRVLAYLHRDSDDPNAGAGIAWDMIRLAWASVARTAITTAQDLLALGTEARMNKPATVGAPNWCWRLPPGSLTPALADSLAAATAIYGRSA